MLDMRLPCENIIRLESSNPDWYKVLYFLMDITPFCAILFLQEGVAPTIKFKQLTGNDAGRVYEESKYATLLYGALNAMDKGYSIGLFNLSKNNRGLLSVAINGYKNVAYPGDIKKVLEKYICIANNNYKEGSC